MANSMWVIVFYSFAARQSHQWCLMPWPTGSEWHCFISLPGSLINDVSSHDKQQVSDAALFLCQAISSCLVPWPTVGGWQHSSFTGGHIISHPTTNRKWVVQVISMPGNMFCLMTNSGWVTVLYVFAARQSHQSCLIPWSTGSEWYCFISLPGSLLNHVSSHDQQPVSNTASFLCQAVSLIMSHPMTNR